MINKERKKILMAFLPDDWKQRGASEFSKSESYIEKVAYGQTYNLEVLDYLTQLAEDNHLAQTEKKKQIENRLDNLPNHV